MYRPEKSLHFLLNNRDLRLHFILVLKCVYILSPPEKVDICLGPQLAERLNNNYKQPSSVFRSFGLYRPCRQAGFGLLINCVTHVTMPGKL